MLGASQPPWYLIGSDQKIGTARRRLYSQFPEIIRKFVIPSNDDCQHWRLFFASVISETREQSPLIRIPMVLPPKVAQLSIFLRNRHAMQFSIVPNGLKISTYE